VSGVPDFDRNTARRNDRDRPSQALGTQIATRHIRNAFYPIAAVANIRFIFGKHERSATLAIFAVLSIFVLPRLGLAQSDPACGGAHRQVLRDCTPGVPDTMGKCYFARGGYKNCMFFKRYCAEHPNKCQH
jgi:hypothetical protein